MITWMQKHKKWLVITIWISTIAFVGAGFVGWGSYDYGTKGGIVATVGEREVTLDEYQKEYSNLYNQYAQVFGTNFNQEMADKMNLKDIAYRQVLQKNLILSYGDKLGLGVTNEDIAKQLVKYKAFLKDGKFDKATYQKVLNQNRTTIKQFEEGLKRDILLSKIQRLFKLETNKNEIENLSKILFLKDDISIKILNEKDINITVNEKDLKEFWEKQKNSYMSEPKYELSFSKMPIMDARSSQKDMEEYYNKYKNDYRTKEGKVKTFAQAKDDVIKALNEKYTKKEALKKYLKVKKDQEKLSTTQTYAQSKLPFDKENIEEILSAKLGKVIKPFLENGEFTIVKVLKKIDAKPLSFDLAKKDARKDFIKVEKDKKLDTLAKKELKNFEGETIKNISREDIDKIKGLDPQESAEFLKQLFSSLDKEGTVKLNDKVVLYKILSSSLAKYDSSKDKSIENTLAGLKQQELMDNLLEKLQNTFEVKSSLKEKE